MAHDLGSNFDEFFPQAGQRPLLDPLRQSQRPQEIAEIVGQRMKLKPHGVGGKPLSSSLLPVMPQMCHGYTRENPRLRSPLRSQRAYFAA
jgi:hypothetical protein